MPTRKRAVLSGEMCEIFCFNEELVARIKKQVAAAKGLSRVFRVLGDETRARIVYALGETRTLMAQIDETIESHGGWPLK